VLCPSCVLAPLELSAAERAQLESWTRRRTSAQALALRSRIVLLAAAGRNNTQIARELGIHRNVAGKWRSRFVEHRLDGLTDEPRPGRPRTITDDKVEEVIVKTLETTPRDATHWSTRSMAREVGLTQSAVLRIWRAFGLQPHRQETWKLSKDPQFIDKVRDVVGLYLDPPERAVVLCVDEKSQIQALDRTAPILPMLPGTPQRATHDYRRRNVKPLCRAGHHHRPGHRCPAQPPPRDRVQEVPADHRPRGPHPAHRAPGPGQLLHPQDAGDPHWLAAHPRFVVHFTPTSSSWLNLVERWFSELTTKKLRRGAHRSVRDLNTDIRAWIDTWNENPRPFVWTKTAEKILDSIARYCTRINESRH
jgi:transposase